MSPLTEPTKLTLKQQSVAPLLLDAYPGAAAAYSLRNLSWAYGGPVVRVRRSSDNTEQDFTAAQVTDGTLTAFCGAGDGLVRTWYDQSGNGSHLSQSTVTNQPAIVTSGSIITANTKPGLQTDGINDFLRCSLAVSTLGISIGLVYKNNASTSNLRLFDLGNTSGTSTSLFASDNFQFAPTGKSFGYRFPQNQAVLGPAPNQNQTMSLYIRSSGALQTASFNSQVFTNTSGTSDFTSQQLTVGASNANGTFSSAIIQELFIYPTDQSTNRAAIEANINAHYAIY